MDKPPDPFHLEGLLPGQNWPLQIEQRIREADYVILVLSPNSIQKQGFVLSEFRIALQAASWRPPNRLYVIPILRAACEVPLFVIGTVKLNDFHWIDYSVEGITPIVETITELSDTDAWREPLSVMRLRALNKHRRRTNSNEDNHDFELGQSSCDRNASSERGLCPIRQYGRRSRPSWKEAF